MKRKNTRQKLIRQVLSGAIHPIILVERAIREHAKSSVGNLPGLVDISKDPFPWDDIQGIRENIAFICQREIWHFYKSRDHYYKDVDRIKTWVFGENPAP